MLETKTRLGKSDQDMDKYLVDSIAEGIMAGKEEFMAPGKALTEIKTVKYSYPKNGLYGLL